jgi:hypothetical protein
MIARDSFSRKFIFGLKIDDVYYTIDNLLEILKFQARIIKSHER